MKTNLKEGYGLARLAIHTCASKKYGLGAFSFFDLFRFFFAKNLRLLLCPKMLLLATFFFLFFSLWFQHVKGTGSFKSSSKQTVFPFCSQDELNYQEETFFGELSRLEHCQCKGREY